MLRVDDVAIRRAQTRDLPDITRIHNEGIEDRIATLDTEPYTIEEEMDIFSLPAERRPAVVAEVNGEVVGWAMAHPFSRRRAYNGVQELSIYVARAWRRRRVGTYLLQALLDLARDQGIYKLILNVLPQNGAAQALYRRFGFREVGVYRNQGVLDGHWTDMVIMERHLEIDQQPGTGS